MSYGVGKWLGSGRVGTSSSALAAAMLGFVPDTAPAYPHDSDDFGRCVVLCGLVEKEMVATGLKELAAISGPWNRLAGCWDELVQLYTTDIKACDRLVRKCGYQGSGFYRAAKGADGRWDYFEDGR